jgi:hypothetical protein
MRIGGTRRRRPVVRFVCCVSVNRRVGGTYVSLARDRVPTLQLLHQLDRYSYAEPTMNFTPHSTPNLSLASAFFAAGGGALFAVEGLGQACMRSAKPGAGTTQ